MQVIFALSVHCALRSTTASGRLLSFELTPAMPDVQRLQSVAASDQTDIDHHQAVAGPDAREGVRKSALQGTAVVGPVRVGRGRPNGRSSRP